MKEKDKRQEYNQREVNTERKKNPQEHNQYRFVYNLMLQ